MVIPDGVTLIPEGAFESAAQLSDLTTGNSVTEFGARAFSATAELTKITLSGEGPTSGLPASLVTIGDYALSGTQISSFDLPDTVRSIGLAAFASSPVSHLTMAEGVTYIGGSAFAGTAIAELSVPDSVENVGTGAFSEMSSLRTIHLGPQIAAGELVKAFSYDVQLRTIDLDPGAINYQIIDGVLFSKDGTELVTYPAGMIPSTRAYTVPSSVVTIRSEAFLKVTLTQVQFPESLRSIEASAFQNSGLTAVVLPDGLDTLGSNAFQGSGSLTDVDLGGTRIVGAYAFNLNTALARVNMRADMGRLTEIRANAFSMAPIAEVTLPDSVTTVGELAFAKNDALRSVHIGASLVTMDMAVFTGSNGLAELTVSADNPVFSADQNVLYSQRADGGASTPLNPVLEPGTTDSPSAVASTPDHLSNTGVDGVLPTLVTAVGALLLGVVLIARKRSRRS